jgi:hypothetical protein
MGITWAPSEAKFQLDAEQTLGAQLGVASHDIEHPWVSLSFGLHQAGWEFLQAGGRRIGSQMLFGDKRLDLRAYFGDTPLELEGHTRFGIGCRRGDQVGVNTPEISFDSLEVPSWENVPAGRRDT